SLPCLTRSPRSGRGSPLSSCVPCRLQPRGTEPQRRHPDQRQTGSTAPDCHRPMRTIWVYKGTPNPPVKPSVVLNRGIVFNLRGWVATAVEPTEPILSKMVIVSLPLSDHAGESLAAVHRTPRIRDAPGPITSS